MGKRILHSLLLFIIDAKLDASQGAALREVVESNGGELAPNPENADIIVSNVRVVKRLERHLTKNQMTSKVVVTPSWVFDSIEKGEMLPFEDYRSLKSLKTRTSLVDESQHTEVAASSPTTQSSPMSYSPISHDSPTHVKVRTHSDNTRFSVHRLSPLECPNQELVAKLAYIKKCRTLDGDDRSALSYARAIGALKAYPKKIESSSEIADLYCIGPKIVSMVDEFLQNGQIDEVRRLSTSRRFEILGMFSSIYFIGPTTARDLHDKKGLRTIEDLERYAKSLSDSIWGRNIRLAMKYREDFAKSIPRNEVEHMADVIYKHLDTIEPGCLYTICGGYRRGKPMSNDVDIVFTHPEKGKEKYLCPKLVALLEEEGLVTDVFYSSNATSTQEGPKPANFGNKKMHGGLEVLDKALTAFRLHENFNNDKEKPVSRRVDLIFASYDAYWTAVVGWTGSTQLERDIRMWANEKGLHFDSGGIMRLRDSKVVTAASEEDVFRILGLEYIPPHLRNVDF